MNPEFEAYSFEVYACVDRAQTIIVIFLYIVALRQPVMLANGSSYLGRSRNH